MTCLDPDCSVCEQVKETEATIVSQYLNIPTTTTTSCPHCIRCNNPDITKTTDIDLGSTFHSTQPQPRYPEELIELMFIGYTNYNQAIGDKRTVKQMFYDILDQMVTNGYSIHKHMTEVQPSKEK